jgi:Ca-activated chloride channel family protein
MSHLRRKSSSNVFLFCLTFLTISVASSLIFAQQKKEKPPSSIASAQTPTPPVSNDTVVLNVTVTSKDGSYISGLNKSQFTLYDNKTPQEITFFDDHDVPMSVGIILDMSASMRIWNDKKRMSLMKEELSRFVQMGNPANEYFLIAFNQRPEVLLDGGSSVDSVAALDKLLLFRGKGNTALFDACYLGLEKVQRGKYPKQAILLISDGGDNNSGYSFDDLRHLLMQSDVMIYSIILFGESDPNSSPAQEGIGSLKYLSSISGGQAFAPRKSSSLSVALESIAQEFKSQYRIGFSPVKSIGSEKWHRLKVDIAPPSNNSGETKRAVVRTRQGYYAYAAQP